MWIQEANQELRQKLRVNGIPLWKVAREVGVTECTIVRWFREELSGERLKRVENAVNVLMANQKI
jgi:hypothetical protein